MGWDYINDVKEIRSSGRRHYWVSEWENIQVQIDGRSGYVNLTRQEWSDLQKFVSKKVLVEIKPKDYAGFSKPMVAVIEDWIKMGSK